MLVVCDAPILSDVFITTGHVGGGVDSCKFYAPVRSGTKHGGLYVADVRKHYSRSL